MPGRNGTGPAGRGPMTGRGMGYCAGYEAPGYAGCGFGRGMGRGRGFRRMYCITGNPGWARYGARPFGIPPSAAPLFAADEKDALQKEAAFLENQLNQVREQLSNFKETE